MTSWNETHAHVAQNELGYHPHFYFLLFYFLKIVITTAHLVLLVALPSAL